MLDVEVEAFTESDAREALDDALGIGTIGALTIVDEEILDHQELD